MMLKMIEYCDMFAKGIIDPVKVVRTALQDAASISGLLVTTEAMIADKQILLRKKMLLLLECLVEWAAWVVWEEWVAWECDPLNKIQRPSFMMAFFLTYTKKSMSKRYSGKSFKDSSVNKKPKLSFKEKEKLREKSEKSQINRNISKLCMLNKGFLSFQINLFMYKSLKK